MKIIIPKAPGIAGLLQNRGAPKFLFRLDDFVINRKIIPIEDNKTVITASQQLRTLYSVLKDPAQLPYLYVMSCPTYTKLISAVALAIMATLTSSLGRGSGKLPYWHYLKVAMREGGDRLSVRPSLLVVDGIVSESNVLRLERARDLLREYEHIPRIMLVPGTDPVTFCEKRLHLHPDYVLYMKENTHVVQI